MILLNPYIVVLYSVLKLFTGFATAAFAACVHTVINAINIAINPGNKNIHHCIFILYAKSCSHLFIANHATGIAIMVAMATNLHKIFAQHNDNRSYRSA